jgi:hypothetical protein
MTTVLHEDREVQVPDTAAEGDSLWLTAGDIEAATGWSWKPEGLCHAETCVPVPPAQRSDFVRDGKLDLAQMWRHSGQPVVHDAGVWVLGTGSGPRASALQSLQAPDFELPDLSGRTHRLSNHRGRKVFLATWSSW